MAEDQRALIRGPWLGPDLDYRAKVAAAVLMLRVTGWGLDDVLRLAPCFPEGLGSLNSQAGPAIREAWADQDAKEASAAEAKAEARAKAAALFDPWSDPPPPEWPGGVLSQESEDTLAAMSLRDGVDFGAQAMAHVAAASGAAPKDARFAPYPHSGWSVPPIIWVMLVAESGQRKTALLTNAFGPLRRLNAARMVPHMAELQRWRLLPEDEKRASGKPPEPPRLIVEDTSLEKLQIILAANPRGALLLKDELAALFDFGRYSAGSGAAERAFYLECYEAGPFTVDRVGRDLVHIEAAALSVFGSVQPERLAAFKGLESDGLLQRIAVVIPARAAISRAGVEVRNQHRLDQAIERLAHLDGRRYGTTPAGADVIRQTERQAESYASITDFGTGFQGFARKLHGTHARIALILHLLENPEAEQVATATIERAGRLTHRFLLPQARDFYSALPGAALAVTRDVAGWLLTKAKDRVLSSDITSNVKPCRGVGLKALAEILDPLVTGGWLTPEDPYPGCRAWFLNTDVRTAFVERALAEAERRAAARSLIGRIGRP